MPAKLQTTAKSTCQTTTSRVSAEKIGLKRILNKPTLPPCSSDNEAKRTLAARSHKGKYKLPGRLQISIQKIPPFQYPHHDTGRMTISDDLTIVWRGYFNPSLDDTIILPEYKFNIYLSTFFILTRVKEINKRARVFGNTYKRSDHSSLIVNIEVH